MANMKKNLPSTRRRKKEQGKMPTKSKALIIHDTRERITAKNSSSQSAFRLAINKFSLRSASTQGSGIVELSSNEESQDEEDELHIRFGSKPATPKMHTHYMKARPQRPLESPFRTPCKPTSTQASLECDTGYLTPPDSGRSGNDSSHHNEDDVHIIGSRLNVASRPALHMWTIEERKLLCILRRFFIADSEGIVAILNGIFPKITVPFKKNMVDMQFAEIRLGKQCSMDAEIAWQSVWNLADFDVASRQFETVLDKLEEKAEEFGIPLTRRENEDPRQGPRENLSPRVKKKPVPVTGRKSGSSTTRTQDPWMNRRHVTSIAQSSSLSPSPNASRTTTTARIRTPTRQKSAVVAMRQSDHALVKNNTRQGESVPPLLFRAFSTESAGTNGPLLIRAGQFTGLPNHTVPPAIEASSEFFRWHAANHLRRERIATPFISLSPSLLWTVHMMYKLKGEDKQIAIINGPAAQNYTRLYRTGPILAQLREAKMYNFRYAGTQEYFAWAEINQKSIAATIGIEHLEALANASPSTRSFLRLDILRSSSSVRSARSKFLEDPLTLDGRIGTAMGKICLLLGISPHDDAIVTEMVFHFLQGWAVQIPLEDTEAIDQAFACFLITFTNSFRPALALVGSRIRLAFEKGVQQAAQALCKDQNATRAKPRIRNNRVGLYDRTRDIQMEDETQDWFVEG